MNHKIGNLYFHKTASTWWVLTKITDNFKNKRTGELCKGYTLYCSEYCSYEGPYIESTLLSFDLVVEMQ